MLLYSCPDIFASSFFPFSLSPCLFLLVYHFCSFFSFVSFMLCFNMKTNVASVINLRSPSPRVKVCVYRFASKFSIKYKPSNKYADIFQQQSSSSTSSSPYFISFFFFVYHFRSQRHPPRRKNKNCPTMLHHSEVFEQPYNIMSSTQKTTRKKKEIYLSIDKTVPPQHSQSAASKPDTLHIILMYRSQTRRLACLFFFFLFFCFSCVAFRLSHLNACSSPLDYLISILSPTFTFTIALCLTWRIHAITAKASR